ncbi:MAG: hypothetical protein HQL09_06975 [Nitrospirae bacterium]|nr:hypothetical protein [Nitrospirota bacterium]
MESANRQMTFAAKEEILRNIVKTHSIILIEGWTGTGKTVTALKAVKGMGAVYYYSEPAVTARNILEYNDKVTVIENVQALRGIAPGRQCIIFDDLDSLGSEPRGILKAMIRERANDRKIIVITKVVLDAQDLLQEMDAVVRFKQNTAQMLHSKLSDFDS